MNTCVLTWMGAILNHLVALMNRECQSLTWPHARISSLKNKRTLLVWAMSLHSREAGWTRFSIEDQGAGLKHLNLIAVVKRRLSTTFRHLSDQSEMWLSRSSWIEKSRKGVHFEHILHRFQLFPHLLLHRQDLECDIQMWLNWGAYLVLASIHASVCILAVMQNSLQKKKHPK